MISKKLMVAAAFVGTAAAVPAYAQDVGHETGVYVAVNGGLASVNKADITYYDAGGTFGGTGATDTADFAVDFDNSFAIGGAIGYDFGLVRTDVEIAYSRSKIKSLTLNSVNGSPVTLSAADGADICDYLDTGSCTVSGNTISTGNSRARQLSALASVWLDVPLKGRVVPYLGGGLGVTGYEIDGEGKARFAWQLGAGVAFNLSSHIALTADFRHRQASGTTIQDDSSANAGVKIGKIKTNTFAAGLRFRF